MCKRNADVMNRWWCGVDKIKWELHDGESLLLIVGHIGLGGHGRYSGVFDIVPRSGGGDE